MKNKTKIKYVIVGTGFYDSSSYSVTRYSYFVNEFKSEKKAVEFLKDSDNDGDYSLSILDLSKPFDLEVYNELKEARR